MILFADLIVALYHNFVFMISVTGFSEVILFTVCTTIPWLLCWSVLKNTQTSTTYSLMHKDSLKSLINLIKLDRILLEKLNSEVLRCGLRAPP